MEKIQVGERLAGFAGTQRRVLALNSGFGEMVRVVPTKGQSFVVNKDHVLTLVHSVLNYVIDVPIPVYLEFSKKKREKLKLFRQEYDFRRKSEDVPIPPYLLGVLLGDGALTQNTPSFTKPDLELVDEVRRLVTKWPELEVRKSTVSEIDWTISGSRGRTNPLQTELARLGLVGTTSHTKFIPDMYLTHPDPGVRQEVLAGLVDTDGHLSSGGYDVISASEQLAENTAFLARSLGFAAYVKPSVKRCQGGFEGTYHRMHISGDLSTLPVKITRKMAPERRQKKSVLRTGFTLEFLGEEEFFGFTLDGDGRYLLDDFTVTHNTGKSTILKAFLEKITASNLRGATTRVALVAPTGKAARRIVEVTEHEASTIHRLLGGQANNGRWMFHHHAGNPLPHQVVVADECSMLDVELADSLLQAVGTGTKLVLVGDANQLPSVGPGQVFADIIDSGVVPVSRLTTVHRAAITSWVCRNAPFILDGDIDVLTEAEDFRFFEVDDPEKLARAVVGLVSESMPQKGVTDVQVLTPQNGGAIGVVSLNRYLQSRLNPVQYVHGEVERELTVSAKGGQYTIRPRDRVIATENDYDREVFNGELGTVVSIADDYSAVVDFDGRPVVFSSDAASKLRLAYALTIHKCVHPDTLVETEQGLQPIREISSDGMIGTVEGMKAYGRKVQYEDRALLTIRTKHGYEITVTEDHGMMAWDGHEYRRQMASQLTEGDFLRLRLGASHETDLTELPGPPASDARARTYALPTHLTEEVAEFLGLMVADGMVYTAGFRLKKRHKDVCDRFAELCGALFGIEIGVKEDKNCWSTEISSTFLSTWLLDLGGLAPHKKAVPELVLRSRSSVQAAFLRGLFEDGGVNVRSAGAVDHVEWSTVYEDMSRTVQNMLLRQGIISSRFYSDGSWRVDIYGDQISTFRDRVGFVSAMKNSLMATAAAKDTRKRIPIDKDWVRKHVPTSPDTKFDRQNALSRGYVSRNVAKKWGLDLGFHHDEIDSIVHSRGPAVCVAVPGHGRFLQNGFDGCNSQGSEWDWVVVVCHGQHEYMWSRQLLYTAVTRAKTGVVIVGNKEGVGAALTSDRPRSRKTRLASLLAKALEE